MTYLGLDIGTSAVKAVLVDEGEAVLAEAEVALAVCHPRPLWAEQDPNDWWRAVEAAFAGLRSERPDALRAVRALGLSGQMHGAVALDAEARVLRPAILWNDGRAHAECPLLAQRVPEIGRIAGVPPMPSFTAPKLLWLRRHEPETMARLAKVLLPKDWVRLRLSGDYVTDASDAAGTLMLDQAARAWSPSILAACEVEWDHLPHVVEGPAMTGDVRPEAAAALGLPEGVRVAGGAGDAMAGAVGIGAVEEGDAFISLGTSAQVFVTTRAYRPKPEAMIHAFAHAVPGRWSQIAALLNGASCLAWVARLLNEPDIAALLARTEAAYRGPSSVLFLPYLAGERTPHDDPHARGVLFGLGADTGPEDAVLAVLEGVAFALAESRDLLAEAGTFPDRLALVGGGTRSPFWMRLLASILDRPLTLLTGGAKGPAFGAARLARMAHTGETAGEVCAKPPTARVFEPDPALVEAYREPSLRFRHLYRALKPEFRRDP